MRFSTILLRSPPHGGARPGHGPAMLFNSQIFLLVFLPLTLLLFYRVAQHPRLRTWTLVAASFVFYGYWEARLVPLLAGSIAVNWLLARHAPRRLLAPIGVTANLALLGVFKYADFFAGTLATLTGAQHDGFGIILPLGISFFTFQQISYLVDRARGHAPLYAFADYALFVSFFPQLIAGPIVRHDQIIGQYRLPPLRDGAYERAGRGLVLLACGLVKKVAFADELARIADPVFTAALAGTPIAGPDAWSGVLAFGFQIYFDFSGYSDMAIGLALLFGLTLPENFNAPYRAVSLIDFWRRWHITLSTFLRDYLYFALGGARRGAARQALALTLTMLLGGLWHGAAWTFVLWGGLHGAGLAVNHAVRRAGLRVPAGVGVTLTFAFVMLAWIPFRAADFASAAQLFTSLWSAADIAPIGLERTWLLVPALLIAVLGPTSQQIAHAILVPRRAWALATGATLAALAIATGGWRTPEFIYFQF